MSNFTANAFNKYLLLILFIVDISQTTSKGKSQIFSFLKIHFFTEMNFLNFLQYIF